MSHLVCSPCIYYRHLVQKKEEEKNEAEEAAAAEREEKVFPLLCLFSLFVPAAYNHLSALRLDEGEEEKKGEK